MHPSEIEKNIENAVNLCKQERHSEALALLELIRPHIPNSPVLLHMRIEALMKLDRTAEALHDCERLFQRLEQIRTAGDQLKPLFQDGQTEGLSAYVSSQTDQTNELKALLDQRKSDALDKETLQTTVSKLEARLQQLLAQQEKAAHEQTELLDELTNLRQKERSTSAALEKAYIDLDEMKESLQAREAEVAEAESELAEKARHVSQLESEVRTLQERSDSAVHTEALLNQELAKLREQGDAKSEELEKARNELSQLQASLSDREAAIQEAQDNNRRHEEAMEAMRQEMSAIYAEADKASEARETLKKELDQLRAAEQSKSEALEAARSQLSELQNALSDREQSVAEAEKRARENELEIERVREQLNNTLRQAEEAERSEAALAEEVAQLRQNEAAKAAALEQTRQEMGALREDLEKREALLAEETQKREMSSEELRVLRQERDEMAKRAASFAESEQQLAQELEHLRKNEEEKSRVLDGARSEMDTLRSQMAKQQEAVLSAEQISSQQDAIVQALQKELEALKLQATTASTSEQELSREVQHLRENESSKTSALAAAQKEMDALRQQLNLREKDAQEAESLNAQKQQELERLRNELNDLRTKTAETLDIESVLAGEMEKLRQNEASKNEELEKSRQELEDLKRVLKTREEDAAKASSEQEESRATIQQLENELAALRHQNLEQQSSQQALQVELTQIHNEAERQGILQASPQAAQLKKIQEQLLALSVAQEDAQQTIRLQASQQVLDEPSQRQTSLQAAASAEGEGQSDGNQLFALNYTMGSSSQRSTQQEAMRVAQQPSDRQTQQKAADIFTGLETTTSGAGKPAAGGITPIQPGRPAPIQTPLHSEAGIPGLSPVNPPRRPHSDSDDIDSGFDEMYPKPRDVSFVFPDQSVSIAVPRRRSSTPVIIAAIGLLIVAIVGIAGFVIFRAAPKTAGAPAAPASPAAAPSDEIKMLTMEFPADRVFGTLYDPSSQPASDADWTPYAPAQGVVEYAEGTRFHLVVRKDQVHDLSPLVPLPDKCIASLWLPDIDMDPVNLNYLQNLKGLDILYIDQELTVEQKENILKGFKRSVTFNCKKPGSIARDMTPPEERVLEFSEDYTIGRVAIRQWNEAQAPWQFLEMARGKVTVPAKMEIQIEINQAEKNLEVLNTLDEMAVHTLVLKGETITDSCLDAVAHLRGLLALELIDTAVTDEGLQKIITIRGLQQIKLHGIAITDAGVKALREFTQLARIDIFDAPGITAESLPAFRSIMALRRLNLEKTSVPIEALRQFAREMSSCSITPN
ncbi:MAG TPA: hypothetical protein PLY90_03805 [Candidatus Hydrogenedentes bacterium]|nr:hypothetical protein [Candidatus Hydrogenedentota bacterium]